MLVGPLKIPGLAPHKNEISDLQEITILKEVSQCFVFDAVKFKKWRSLITRFVLDVVNFEEWGSLAEELRFQACR